MNSELLNLYKENWTSYLEGRKILSEKNLAGEKLDYTRPLLIQLKDEAYYKDADKKIMILGQETNGWAEGGAMTPENSIENYISFFGNGSDVKYKGPFWNETKRFIRMLKNRFPNQKIVYTYNNVVKIGKSSGIGFPGETVYNIELSHFNVLKQEIDILKPDLLLFFSGPNYDSRIQDKLGGYSKIKLTNYDEKDLCLLRFDNDIGKAFRTYHPRAMYQKKLNQYDYFNSIIDITFGT